MRREELLRPNKHLGYDRETIAYYLYYSRSYTLAEAQYRRMIWLNPYEPRFHAGLAHCLIKQKRVREALECVEAGLRLFPGNRELEAAKKTAVAALQAC